ncbi:MAG: bifunctional 5,10-methylenetetrahydrofolate dehydrogenase/5,10-methenyltetrahydrofolate cyclohydrolase [Myxococcales bacterium]|nr:bifunctional 5,10-methylenetetrahydrofolate dehydrogenase/5,10-methenyltetrahydrofolate cyclohydrolase [Myxococcales bacterium]
MQAKLLEGGPVAEAILRDVRQRVSALSQRRRPIGLATVLVGSDRASAGYVRKKHEACEAVGMVSHHHHVPEGATQAELLEVVDRLNRDAAVDGYLVQHPVPPGFDLNQALLSMDPDKDADGLHPVNLGRLVLQEPGPIPATPAGIRAMLLHYGVDISGRRVVIVGRGPTLGRPLSLLLSAKQPGGNAAVTVVHSAVPDLSDYTRQADVVIAAVGKPGIVVPDMLRPGAVAINGGISWKGRKLLPDVAESCAERASWITPRLGGVGVTTVAMLLRNAVALAERRVDSDDLRAG